MGFDSVGSETYVCWQVPRECKRKKAEARAAIFIVAIYFAPRYAVVFGQKLEEGRCASISHLADFAVDSFNRMFMNGDGLWEFLIARDRSKLGRLVEEYRDGV